LKNNYSIVKNNAIKYQNKLNIQGIANNTYNEIIIIIIYKLHKNMSITQINFKIILEKRGLKRIIAQILHKNPNISSEITQTKNF
jgi:hypothetical protein